MKARVFFILAALLVPLTGCEDAPPPGDPPPSSFADYYAGELFVTERVKLQDGNDSLLQSRLDSLRRVHGITLPVRDSLLAYCQETLPRWEAFLGEVLKRLDARAKQSKQVTQAKPEKSTGGTDGGKPTTGVPEPGPGPGAAGDPAYRRR